MHTSYDNPGLVTTDSYFKKVYLGLDIVFIRSKPNVFSLIQSSLNIQNKLIFLSNMRMRLIQPFFDIVAVLSNCEI